MKTELDVFREEDLILSHMEQVGRLDKERELDRLVNVINDIIVEYSQFDPEEIEVIYSGIKDRLKREYYKTNVLGVSSTEMKIWHLSVFSSIEMLQKLLVNRGFDEPDEVLYTFDEILQDHFEEQLQRFSEEYDIDDLSDRLPEPEIFHEDDHEVRYYSNMGQNSLQLFQESGNPRWHGVSQSGTQQPIEVQM